MMMVSLIVSKIYQIECKITGLLYVGQTCKSLSERFRYHGYDARDGSKAKLHQSMREYGKDNHIISLLEQTDSPDERECFWIEKLDSLKNGLNTAQGGGAFPVMKGKEHWLHGKTHSEESCKKISDNHADFTGAKNGRARCGTLYFVDGSTERFDCLKQWCKDRGYKQGALVNRIVGGSCSNGKKPTTPHMSGVTQIILD